MSRSASETELLWQRGDGSITSTMADGKKVSTDLTAILQWRSDKRRGHGGTTERPNRDFEDWKLIASDLRRLIDTSADVTAVSRYVSAKRGYFSSLEMGRALELPTSSGMNEQKYFLVTCASWRERGFTRRHAVFCFDERLQLQYFLLSHRTMIDKVVMMRANESGEPEAY